MAIIKLSKLSGLKGSSSKAYVNTKLVCTVNIEETTDCILRVNGAHIDFDHYLDAQDAFDKIIDAM